MHTKGSGPFGRFPTLASFLCLSALLPANSQAAPIEIGDGAEAINDGIAIGNLETIANGLGSIALEGGTVDGTESLASGVGTYVHGNYSYAFGHELLVDADNAFALGKFNLNLSQNGLAPTSGTPLSTDPIFEIGNGADTNALANAFTLFRNGTARFTGDLELATSAGVVRTTLKTDATSAKTVTFPNASGTVLLSGSTSDISLTSGTANVGIGTASPAAKLSVQGNGTGTGLALQTADSTGAAKFTILDSGNVGIGTIDPTYTLQVTGTTSISGILRANGGVGVGADPTTSLPFNSLKNNNASVSFYNYNTNSGSGASAMFAARTNAGQSQFGGYGAGVTLNGLVQPSATFVRASSGMTGGLILRTDEAAPIIFGISAAEVARISSGGNLGLGVTTPSEKLDVVGNAKVSGTITGTSVNTAALYNTAGSAQALAVDSTGTIGVKTTLRLPQRGDLAMGEFTTGTAP